MASENETVENIVAEMRECAGRMEKRGLYDLRECGTDYLRALADLIEAAHQRGTATDSRRQSKRKEVRNENT